MLEPERISTEFVEITEYHKIPEIINNYVDIIEEIGPNPFKDMLRLSGTGNIKQILIYNSLGQLVSTHNIQGSGQNDLVDPIENRPPEHLHPKAERSAS